MTGNKTGSVDFGCCLCSSMEEQFRPKERVGGSSPSRGTRREWPACELESVRGSRVPHNSWKARIEDFLRAIPVVPFGIEEASKAGEITRYLTEQGVPPGPYDILIAAQAIVSGSTLVTHNTRHFETIPLLKLADWVEE